MYTTDSHTIPWQNNMELLDRYQSGGRPYLHLLRVSFSINLMIIQVQASQPICPGFASRSTWPWLVSYLIKHNHGKPRKFSSCHWQSFENTISDIIIIFCKTTIDTSKVKANKKIWFYHAILFKHHKNNNLWDAIEVVTKKKLPLLISKYFFRSAYLFLIFYQRIKQNN